MSPCWDSPSRQHRNVLLPGVIIAPCADADGALTVVITRPAISMPMAANTVVALLRVIVPSFLLWERSQFRTTVTCPIAQREQRSRIPQTICPARWADRGIVAKIP